MNPLRRFTAVAVLAVTAVVMALLLASCGKNSLLGDSLELWIGIKGVGPQGNGADGNGCSVISIDSLVFVQDVDPSTFTVTSFLLADSLGNPVPGTAMAMPSNVYIEYYLPWPNTSYTLLQGKGLTSSAVGKVYFVPAAPLSPHKLYTYSLTTGVRMRAGKLVRDVQSFSFVTGDSVAPPTRAN